MADDCIKLSKSDNKEMHRARGALKREPVFDCVITPVRESMH